MACMVNLACHIKTIFNTTDATTPYEQTNAMMPSVQAKGTLLYEQADAMMPYKNGRRSMQANTTMPYE